jgi:hypothetical protein
MKYTNYRQNRPLSIEEMEKHAPSIFTEEPYHAMSDKYTNIPTIRVIEALEKEGFKPFMVGQSGYRNPDKREFVKHVIRLRHETEIEKKDVNELVLVNSHNGASAYSLMSGVFVMVCANGLIAGDFKSQKTKHMGDVVDSVIEGAYTVLKSFEEVEEKKDVMKATLLSKDEQLAYAKAAITYHYGSVEESPIAPTQLLRPRRREERDQSVWTTYNVAQEHLIRGGLPGFKGQRRVRTRPVGSIDKNIALNKALWTLAQELVR